MDLDLSKLGSQWFQLLSNSKTMTSCYITGVAQKKIFYLSVEVKNLTLEETV